MLNNIISVLLRSILLSVPIATASSSSAANRPSSITALRTASSSLSTTTSSNSSTTTSASPYLPSPTQLLVVAFSSQFSIAASVVSYNSTATTYRLTAANSVYSPEVQLTVGPKTWRYYQVDQYGTVYNTNCNLAGTTYASCLLSNGEPGAGPQIQRITATNSDEFSSYLSFASVTIVTQLPTGPKWSTAGAPKVHHPERTAGAVVAAAMLAGQILG